MMKRILVLGIKKSQPSSAVMVFSHQPTIFLLPSISQQQRFTTTTTPPPASSKSHTTQLDVSLLNLVRNETPETIRKRRHQILALVEPVPPLHHLTMDKLMLCLESISFCSANIPGRHFVPVLEAIVNQLVTHHSTDKHLLDRFVNGRLYNLVSSLHSISPALLKQLDALLSSHVESLDTQSVLKPDVFPMLLSLGLETQRALLGHTDRFLMAFVQQPNQLAQAKLFLLNQVTSSALIYCKPQNEDVNQLLRTLVESALSKASAYKNHVVSSRVLFNLSSCSFRRAKVDENWKALTVAEMYSRKPFPLGVDTRFSPKDICNASSFYLAYYKHLSPSCTNTFVIDLMRELERQMSQPGLVESFPGVLSQLRTFLHLNAVPNEQREECERRLVNLANLVATQCLHRPPTTLYALERLLWDIEGANEEEIGRVFDQVVAPLLVKMNKVWDENTIRMLLRCASVPRQALVSLLVREEFQEGSRFFVHSFAQFNRLSGKELETLRPKLEALFLRAPLSSEQVLTGLDFIYLTKLFAGNSECLAKIWSLVFAGEASQFTSQTFSELLTLFDKSASFHQDEAFLALSMEKKLSFTDLVKPSSQSLIPTPDKCKSLSNRDLCRIVNQVKKDLVEVQVATDELLVRIEKNPEKVLASEMAIPTACCVRVEMKEEDSQFSERLRPLLPHFPFPILCRLAGSSAVLREDCCDEIFQQLPHVNLTAFDAVYAFNNFLPRYSTEANLLDKEQEILSFLVSELAELPFSHLPVKMLVNALKTLMRLDVSFPQVTLNREILLNRLKTDIVSRAGECPSPAITVQIINLLTYFGFEEEAKQLTEPLLLTMELSSVLLLANAEDLLVEKKYGLHLFRDMEDVMERLPATERLMDFMASSPIVDTLSFKELLHVAKWISLHQRLPLSSPQVELFQKLSRHKVEEGSSVELIKTLAAAHFINDVNVFKAALEEVCQVEMPNAEHRLSLANTLLLPHMQSMIKTENEGSLLALVVCIVRQWSANPSLSKEEMELIQQVRQEYDAA